MEADIETERRKPQLRADSFGGLIREIAYNKKSPKMFRWEWETPSLDFCEEISASPLSYKHVHALKSAVYRERFKLRPTIPKSIEAVFSAAESPAFGLDSFDVITRDEPNKILITTSEDNILHLSACENILGDGTFKSCPKFFEQLYTLHGYKDVIYSPCVFALLPDKKKPTYIRMLHFSKVPATKETLH